MVKRLPELPEALERAYRDGELVLVDVAERLGCSVAGARNLLLRAGVTMNGRGYRTPGKRRQPRLPGKRPVRDPARDATIRQLREEGLTLQAIGECFGLTKERIRQIAAGRSRVRSPSRGEDDNDA